MNLKLRKDNGNHCFLKDCFIDPLEIKENYFSSLSKEEWRKIALTIKLNKNFVYRYKDCIPWDCVSINKSLTVDILKEFPDKLDWVAVIIFFEIPEEIILNYYKYISWKDLGYFIEFIPKNLMAELSFYIPEKEYEKLFINKKYISMDEVNIYQRKSKIRWNILDI